VRTAGHQRLDSHPDRTPAATLHVRRNRIPKGIEYSQYGLRLRVLHLHLNSPEVEHGKPALEDEAAVDDILKAANWLNIDVAAILSAVVYQ